MLAEQPPDIPGPDVRELRDWQLAPFVGRPKRRPLLKQKHVVTGNTVAEPELVPDVHRNSLIAVRVEPLGDPRPLDVRQRHALLDRSRTRCDKSSLRFQNHSAPCRRLLTRREPGQRRLPIHAALVTLLVAAPRVVAATRQSRRPAPPGPSSRSLRTRQLQLLVGRARVSPTEPASLLRNDWISQLSPRQTHEHVIVPRLTTPSGAIVDHAKASWPSPASHSAEGSPTRVTWAASADCSVNCDIAWRP